MRSFTIESVHQGKSKLQFQGGRYISNTPVGAAKKAFSQVCQHYSAKNYMITIRETTQGSDKKEYSYRVSRKLDPVDVTLKNGETITFNYVIKAKSV